MSADSGKNYCVSLMFLTSGPQLLLALIRIESFLMMSTWEGATIAWTGYIQGVGLPTWLRGD